MLLKSDMGDTRTISKEILMNFGNCRLETLNFSYILFLKLKYYGSFSYIIQYDHLNAHLSLKKSNKPSIIAEIYNSQFVEVLNVPKMCPQKVLNFSRVCSCTRKYSQSMQILYIYYA
jgi:hypothetical protein